MKPLCPKCQARSQKNGFKGNPPRQNYRCANGHRFFSTVDTSPFKEAPEEYFAPHAPPDQAEAAQSKDFDQLFKDNRAALIEAVRDKQRQAQQYTTTISRSAYREAVLSDHQIPFQDDLAVEISFELLRDYNPDLIYLLGDVMDNFAVSRWLTDPTRKCYEMERALTLDYLQRIRREFPRADVRWYMGNHELRLRSELLKKAPALADLLENELSFERIFDLDALNIHVVYKPQAVGKLYHLHGHENYTQGQVVHVALRNLRWLKRSSICGHWHRFQAFWDKEVDGSTKIALTNGCLFDSSIMPGGGYTSIDTGQRGITLIDYDEMGHFHAKPIDFLEAPGGYQVFYEGQFHSFTKSL